MTLTSEWMVFIDTLTNAESKLNCENIFTQNFVSFAKAMNISRQQASGNFLIDPQP